MVEGGKIDWACHSNDAATAFNEVVDLDDAIKVAYEFYEQHPDETLIVVTADHETGGLTLVDGDLQKGEIVGKFSTGGHSGVMVPVYAFGPGANNFTGIYENSDIFKKITTLMGW